MTTTNKGFDQPAYTADADLVVHRQSLEQLRCKLIGAGFQVEPPSGRGQQFEAMMAAYSMMVNISSLFALFIGMFIIYNSFAIAVTQRRADIGILRALGATRAQIRSLFLVESAVLGQPVVALCGKVWVPTRDPGKFPVCPECREIFEGLPPGGEGSE